MSKISKQRECPAAGHRITAAECGENRGSRYACPAECSYFPFAPANYEALLALEAQVDQKGAQWMFQESRQRHDPVTLQERADRIKSGLELQAFMVWNVFLRPDASGLNCVQRWEKCGFSGVKNDERVMLRAKTLTRVAMLEVHRILDSQRTEGVDLLAPTSPPVVIMDRSLAAIAPRFGIFLTWMYPLPHFWRLFGAAIQFPEFGPFEPEEVAVELIRHLGGPVSEPERRLWLAEHFVRFEEGLHATGLARRAEMFARMDAQFGRAVYKLNAPFRECRRVLDQEPDVEPDELADEEKKEGFFECRAWIAEKSLTRAETVGGHAILGRALMGQTHWRLQAFGAERLKSLRKRFEAKLGSRVQFVGERRDDLAASMALKDSKFDRALVPPRLLENVEKIILESSRVPVPSRGEPEIDPVAELAARQDRSFLEDAIPALDGRTPREAARDPVLRPKLFHLLKSRIRDLDERNLKSGRNEDLNWMLRELGADELIFDPPPPRKPVDLRAGQGEDDLGDGNQNRPMPPPLPSEPLGLPEVNRRLQAAMAPFETAAEAMKELLSSGSFLLEDAHELAKAHLHEDEFAFLVVFLLQAWFSLVPRGSRAPDLNSNDFAKAFDTAMEAVVDSINKSEYGFLKRLLEECRQPVLIQMVAFELMEAAKKLPETKQFRPPCILVMIALIRATVDTVDEALRPG
ncbi:MAG: hypothetical protein HY735_34765 [Verrucomicrobia bacterium]|nr:hypothetical protein [Verrucomicrobiota bacterium]